MTTALSIIPRRSVLGAALATVAAGTVSAATASPTAVVLPDPIFPAIQAVRAAEAELTAALKDLDEDDPVQMRRADEAADRSGDARNVLSATRPTTPAGFRALVHFHAADVAWMEPDTYGALAVRDIAAAMDTLMRARASPG